MTVVVDTNILFSALLKTPNKFAENLFLSDDSFFAPKHVLSELLKHKKKLSRFSKLSEENLQEMLSLLSKRIHVIEEDSVSDFNMHKAYYLCKEVDIKDMPVVAVALELDAYLWTGDKILIKGLKSNGFNKFYKINSD